LNLHEELRCARCGTPSLADDEFCEACGAPLGTLREHDRIELDAGGAGGVSDRGRVHRRNEDALFVHSSDGCAVVVVCDGVSMSAAPHVASAVAADVAGEALVAALHEGSGDGDRSEAIEVAVQAALKAVLDVPWMPSPGDVLSSPACTLVAAVWDGQELAIGWAGDSRAYWLGADGPALLTVDHSWAQEQVAAGVMTLEAAESDRRAHAITRWLGADAPEDIPQVVTFHPSGPGRLLVCSDGLWNYASTAGELAELAATAPEQTPIGVARTLTDIAVELGGRDNITVAVVEVQPTPDGPANGEEA
jgi:serine/threonine protein phosphatase PrpC